MKGISGKNINMADLWIQIRLYLSHKVANVLKKKKCHVSCLKCALKSLSLIITIEN